MAFMAGLFGSAGAGAAGAGAAGAGAAGAGAGMSALGGKLMSGLDATNLMSGPASKDLGGGMLPPMQGSVAKGKSWGDIMGAAMTQPGQEVPYQRISAPPLPQMDQGFQVGPQDIMSMAMRNKQQKPRQLIRMNQIGGARRGLLQ